MNHQTPILPEPAFLELRAALQNRLAKLAADLQPGQIAEFLEPLPRQILTQGFTQAGAHEGTLWVVDAAEKNLAPIFNTGPQAQIITAGFRQPLAEGLLSMVFAAEQPFLENEIWKNARQSKRLDTRLGVQTAAMIAVPFYLLRACRGVVSCVQLRRPDAPEPAPPGFGPEHLAAVQQAGALVSELIEYRLLSRVVGWSL